MSPARKKKEVILIVETEKWGCGTTGSHCEQNPVLDTSYEV